MADAVFCSSCGQTLPIVDEPVELELLKVEPSAPVSDAEVVAEVAHHALDTIESIVDAHETTDLVAELADAVETVAEEESEAEIVDAVVDDPEEEPEPDDEEPPDEELDDERVGEDDVDATTAELLEPADEVVAPVAPVAPRRRRGLPMRR